MKGKRLAIIQILAPILLLSFSSLKAQEHPPVPAKVEVNTARFLNFGSFTTGISGGTVSVDHTGNRTGTGDITLMNMGLTPSAAMFYVWANPGTILHITAEPDIELRGANGGFVYLNIDSFSTGQTFINTGNRSQEMPVEVGGTLSVGDPASSPPGQYNGTFTLTFIHQ